MCATARGLGGQNPVIIAGNTNIYMDATTSLATESTRTLPLQVRGLRLLEGCGR